MDNLVFLFLQGLSWLWVGRVTSVTCCWAWSGWTWTSLTSWRMSPITKTRWLHTHSSSTTKVSHTEAGQVWSAEYEHYDWPPDFHRTPHILKWSWVLAGLSSTVQEIARWAPSAGVQPNKALEHQSLSSKYSFPPCAVITGLVKQQTQQNKSLVAEISVVVLQRPGLTDSSGLKNIPVCVQDINLY